MDITFKENQIEIFWKFKGVKEEKTWDWIKGSEEVDGIYYLDLDIWPKNVIMIKKHQLTSDEDNALCNWLHKNRKM